MHVPVSEGLFFISAKSYYLSTFPPCLLDKTKFFQKSIFRWITFRAKYDILWL